MQNETNLKKKGDVMNDLTDKELPGYLRLHCMTPVGKVHKKHMIRIHELAGWAHDVNIIKNNVKEFWRPDSEWIDKVCSDAEQNMKEKE